MVRAPRPLARSFFERDALQLAPALVGAELVRLVPDGTVRIMRIVETESYRGPDDAACHARFGLTQRTRSLFGPPGFAYVFLIYGMYDCFNVVALEEGRGHAVLIRAAEPVCGIAPETRGDGPGRLTRALHITRAHDGWDLTKRGEIYVAAPQKPARVVASPRVGVGYAGAVAEEPWRFFDADSAWVSRPSAKQIGLGLTAKRIPSRARGSARRRPT